MLLLLPPSETKRDGGAEGSSLDLTSLSYPELTPERTRAIRALKSLSRSVSASTAALRLGATQRFEIDRNRELSRSPVLPAIERYTGVLFDALSAATLSPAERHFADEHVAIQSALFGLLGAGDAIPAYRLSHDSRLPGLPLGSLWRDPVTSVLAQEHTARHGLILDLRSEAYAALGPIPPSAWYLRVVSDVAVPPSASAMGRTAAVRPRTARAVIPAALAVESASSGAAGIVESAAAEGIAQSRGPLSAPSSPGSTRRVALSHANKAGKGTFARAVIAAGINHPTPDSLLEWARSVGIRLEYGAPGELDLVV